MQETNTGQKAAGTIPGNQDGHGGGREQGSCRPAQEWIMELYILSLLVVFPFFNTDKYFSILSDRATFFKDATMVMAAALFVEWVMRIAPHMDWDRTQPGAAVNARACRDATGRPRKIPAGHAFLAAFLAVCAVSTAMSGHTAEAWSGEEGRLQGMSMWLAYGACFCCTARFFRPKKRHLWLLLASGTIAALWGIGDYMGPGLNWWLAEVKQAQKHMFTSCIGNINTYTAFIIIPFSLAGAYIVYADGVKEWQQSLLTALSLIFSAALITGRSDNAAIGAAVLFLALPFGIKGTRQLGRYLWLVSAFAIAIVLSGILAMRTANPYMEGQEGILLKAAADGQASFLAASVGIIAAVVSAFCMAREEKPLPEFRGSWALFLAICSALAALVLIYANFFAEPGLYGAAEPYLKFSDSWGTGRGLCWRLAFESYAKFPPLKKLIGSGPETFGIIMEQEHHLEMVQGWGQVFDSPHNELIQHLFCTGILGAACYYGFLAACSIDGVRKGAIGKAAAAAILAYTAVSFVNISVPITQPYIIMLAAWCQAPWDTKKGERP